MLQRNKSSLFKFSNAANLFQNLIIESMCFRALEFDNQTTLIWKTVLLTIYMATLFIAYRPKSVSANPFQIPIIDSICGIDDDELLTHHLQSNMYKQGLKNFRKLNMSSCSLSNHNVIFTSSDSKVFFRHFY